MLQKIAVTTDTELLTTLVR